MSDLATSSRLSIVIIETVYARFQNNYIWNYNRFTKRDNYNRFFPFYTILVLLYPDYKTQEFNKLNYLQGVLI